ncbi:DUF3822 family protein [Antarcticibacterium flavum]|uniref:DUF3822 family protein n=1 Tax=Antarcticibacterium flavum TaxID=2058175 RepID=A0A5B7X0Y8_9FLAO|nr:MULTISPECIES: DUF3822 family protein [Antarcticibacterium]MCM4159029.1 DUF3822 domain-containing protein [Antarcticibacterium sp. W02-3]QCY68273.1 DUF3822 family protein [Antarcticibacterium flavum]
MEKEESSKENNSNLKMSIQVRLNGLSFCTRDSTTGEITWYYNEDFNKEYNPVKILQHIEKLYNTVEQLNFPVRDVNLLFSHDLYTFVPKEFFVEDEASTYLKFSTKILKTDVVAHDHLEDRELVNVYIPYTNINNFFFEKYGEFEFRHSSSVLVEEAFKIGENKSTKAILNSFKGYYDLVIVKGNDLLFCNTFTYDTKEDFIYYLLFTLEQLKLEPESLDLYLLGNITEDSPNYKILYTYVKYLHFLEVPFSGQNEKFNNPLLVREAFLQLKSLE